MALNRQPQNIPVTGAALLVKGDSSGLFSTWQRIPGLASFTLPDETGSTNETQLIDGSVQNANIASVGTITGNIGAISAHPTHRWLAAKRRSGDQIKVAILKPAAQTISVISDAGSVDAAARLIAIASGSRSAVVAAIREGMIVALADAITKGFVAYDATPVAGDNHKWRGVNRVNADGSVIEVEAGITTAVAAGSEEDVRYRIAGVLVGGDEGFDAQVNGFGDGDFQAGGNVAANISFAPPVALPVRQVEWRGLVAGELQGTSGTPGTNHGGSDISASPNAPYDGVFNALST